MSDSAFPPKCPAVTTDISWPGDDALRRCELEPHPPGTTHIAHRPDGSDYNWVCVNGGELATRAANCDAATEGWTYSVTAICALAEKLGGGRFTSNVTFDEALAFFESEIAKRRSMAPLPAQMGEVRSRMLALKKMCIDNGGDVVERRAVAALCDSALAVMPVQHDDQQGGAPVEDSHRWTDRLPVGDLIAAIDPSLGRSFEDGSVCGDADLLAAGKQIVLGLRLATRSKAEVTSTGSAAIRELGEAVINLRREVAASRRPLIFEPGQTSDMAVRLRSVRDRVRQVIAAIGPDHPAFEDAIGAANDVTAIFAAMPAKE